MLITNKDCRKLLLHINGHLGQLESKVIPHPKSKKWLLDTVDSLGFVQIDPISVVEKAHYHILFSRNKHFWKDWLTDSLETERTLFENWTHDAAILPVGTWPYWKHYFQRFKNFEIHKGYKRYFEPLKAEHIDNVLRHIEDTGASKPSDIPSDVIHWNDPYFTKTSLSKMASEYLWRTGELCVAERKSIAKVYDLSERVIPEIYMDSKVDHHDYVDWACRKALKQLGFARASHIARFMDAISKETAEVWCQNHLNELQQISVEYADKSSAHMYYALNNTLENIDRLPPPTKKLKLLNPFDPLTRDRSRLSKIFGFDYTIEIWVPKAKRIYGYYVLPIIEGNRFVGRIDLKADRKSGVLNVLGLWWEKGVRESQVRNAQLKSELRRLAQFTGLRSVNLSYLD